MNRLLQATLILLSFAATTTRATIRYTDINPDTIVTANSFQILRECDLDLDNDGTIDFFIAHRHRAIMWAEFYTAIGQVGEVMTSNLDSVLALNINQIIEPNSLKWTCKSDASGATPLFMNNPWAGKQDKYVGVRIKKGADWYYGWIRMTVPADLSSITIKDYAFNQNANMPILAGQITTTGVSTGVQSNLNAVIIAPNPFSAAATIESRVDNSTLNIYNSLGQSIRTIRFLTAGKVTLQRENLASGIYYYELKKGGECLATGKLLLQ